MNKRQTLLLLVLPMMIMIPTFCTKKIKKPPSKPAPVEVAVVIQKTVPIKLKTIGKVSASATVTVKSRVTGQLMTVHFKEGTDVKQGDPLFTIDPIPFELALNQAEANLAKDEAQVKKEEANLQRDRVLSENAWVEVKRYKDLLDKNMIPANAYDKLHTTAKALTLTLKVDRAAKGVAEAMVIADKAMVTNAKTRLAYCTISAPIGGRTGSLLIKAGNQVRENDTPLVIINQITPIEVQFALSEKYLGAIQHQIGERKILPMFAYLPHDAMNFEQGVLSFVDNAIDPETGTIRLKGTFANKEKRLWPGQFVQMHLLLKELPNQLVVPSKAIQTGQEGQYVFVVKPDRTVEVRPVSVGPILEDETVIEKGLAPNETVVTDGHLRLYPGALVEVKNLPPTNASKTDMQ